MRKQSSSTNAGPSQSGKPRKTIARTAELLGQNEQDKRKGKVKAKAVLGDVSGLVLPSALQVERFAEIRALEIIAFQNAIKSAAAHGSSRVFQSLPRHLRRRAASHNPRRVPKRMRSKATAEIDPGDNVAKIERKKAKLRARGNLRGEFRTEQLLKRQRDKSWLPTHIWHAKRFHMTTLWSHRLPLTPTLKSFRPAYRAARRKAIVQDVSYFGTIELQGTRERLLGVLGRLTGGGKFAGAKYELGGRMGDTMLYHREGFPPRLIGPVEILWEPHTGHNERRIWLRLHPSIFEEAWDALKAASTIISSATSNEASSSCHDQPDMVSAFQMRDLREDIDAFEILGPKAGFVLRRVLRLCRDEVPGKAQFYESLRYDPAELPEGMIVGLKVYDPRLHFPPNALSRTEADTSDGLLHSAMRFQPSAELARSSLWDAEERDALAKPTFKKSDLDHRRQQLGLPGTRLRPTAQDDRISIILIQRTLRSQNAETEAMHGFTILLPRGWSMYLLQSIAYTGTLAGGLAERRTQHREAGVHCFPEHYGAVCKAGTEWEKKKGIEEEERWSRKPPGKRAEWGSMGTRDPFIPDWTEIMDHDDDSTTEEEKLLNGSSFDSVPPWLLNAPFTDYISAISSSSDPPDLLLAIINAFRSQRSMSTIPSNTAQKLYSSSLVHVRVEVSGRGSPGDMTVIYLLSSEGRQTWLEAQEQDILLGRAGHAELVTIDNDVSEIQRLGEITPRQEDVIGYVTTGNFSLSRGRGHALATVTLSGYIEMLRLAADENESHRHLVLVKVRNRDGRICRLASLVIV